MEAQQPRKALWNGASPCCICCGDAAHGVEAVDAHWRYLFVSAPWARALGYRPEELLGHSGQIVTHPDDVAASREMLKAISSGSAKTQVLCKRFLRKNGSVLWAQVCAAGRHGSDGKLQAVVSVTADVTEIKEQESRLLGRIDELQAERDGAIASRQAMRQLLMNLGQDESHSAEAVQSNIDRIVLPLLRTLESQTANANRELVQQLRTQLEDVAAPFVSQLAKRFRTLTPREIRICEMVRRGLATKEIASALHISALTVNKHREHIRRKLGLTGRPLNLASFLSANVLPGQETHDHATL